MFIESCLRSNSTAESERHQADAEMDTQSLDDLRKNLQLLIAQSGMSREAYAERHRLPWEVLQRLLSCEPDDPQLARQLEALSDRLGISVCQLSSSNLARVASGEMPDDVNRLQLGNPEHLLARQLGRLIEDFVECDDTGRFEVTALAQELAEERLRKIGRASRATAPPA